MSQEQGQPFVDPHRIQEIRVDTLREVAEENEAKGKLSVMRPADAQRIERGAAVKAEEEARRTQATGHAAVAAGQAAESTVVPPDHRLTA